MVDQNWALLRQHLLDSYQELVRLLARRLRSKDRAEDALQDAYLRLERGGEIGAVKSPRGYLLRMALNIAAERLRSESRHTKISGAIDDWGASNVVSISNRRLTVSDGKDFIHLVDDTPDPERIVVGRSDLKLLTGIVAELPSRRRAIFMAACMDGKSHQEIAKTFGLSIRSVQHELKLARQFCTSRYRSEQ